MVRLLVPDHSLYQSISGPDLTDGLEPGEYGEVHHHQGPHKRSEGKPGNVAKVTITWDFWRRHVERTLFLVAD